VHDFSVFKARVFAAGLKDQHAAARRAFPNGTINDHGSRQMPGSLAEIPLHLSKSSGETRLKAQANHAEAKALSQIGKMVQKKSGRRLHLKL
jgi:hypothetical protein